MLDTDKNTVSLAKLKTEWHVANLPTSTVKFHVIDKTIAVEPEGTVTPAAQVAAGESATTSQALPSISSAFPACERKRGLCVARNRDVCKPENAKLLATS